MNLPPALRKTPTWLFATVVLTLTSTAANAATYLETFDNQLNPAIWNLTSGGNDWVISGGELTITRLNSSSGTLAFLPQVIGDFDVRFDYALNWTTSGQDRIQLTFVTDAPAAYAYAVGHTQEGPAFGVAVDPVARHMFGPITPMGTLRTTRIGSAVTMQYLNNSDNWVTLQTGSDTRNMWVTLDNFIFQSFTAGSSVVIDNFSITADQFSAPIPEPETWALLLAGFGLVGFAARRRRG